MLFHPIMSRGQIRGQLRGQTGTKRDNGQTQKGDKRGHISIDMSPIVPECPLVQFVPQPTLKGFKEMTNPPENLPPELKDVWIQATEAAFMRGVEKTLLRLSKQLGRNLSVNIDAEFLADTAKSPQVLFLDDFR